MDTPTVPWKLAQAFCRICMTRWFDLKVYGHKHVPRTGPVLLVANHQSVLDPVLVGVRLERPLWYLAKSELFENLRVAALLRSFNSIPVRQGAGDVRALKETLTRLRQGHALAIFPEGARSEDGELLPVERGVGLIVRRAQVPVVPVVLDGSFQAWPKGRICFQQCKIRVLYGPPADLSHLSAGEIVDWVGLTMRKMFNQLRQMERSRDPSALPRFTPSPPVPPPSRSAT
jgi:1-acyl-sn-glycerol-3-phosphate acyltransferase